KPLPSAANPKYFGGANETGSSAVGGASIDQSLTSPLRAAVARKWPLGEKSTAVIGSVWPRKVRTFCHREVSQRRTEGSPPTVASQRPSGENAARSTEAESRSSATRLRSSTFQTRVAEELPGFTSHR